LKKAIAEASRTGETYEQTMSNSSAEAVIDLYERHAAHFDQDRGKVLIKKQWLNRFRALLSEKATILDMGCGSGKPIAAYLIGWGCRLMGIDSSPSMIAMCEIRFPDHRWAVADMRTMHLAKNFDGIVAWNSFFHLTPDDQRAMFPVFKAHAKPGSALLFTSGPQAGEVIGSYRGEALYHASLDPAEYRALLAASGFSVIAYVAEDATCGRHTVWLGKCDA
jgi:SAM-dependent methyltransferase